MRQRSIVLLSILGAVVILSLGVTIALRHVLLLALMNAFIPVPPRDQLYPAAPPMPPAVSAPVNDLLAEHENFLRTNAPRLFSTLQPGLSGAEIDKLEAQYHFKLTPDLRALYRWRNGTPRSALASAFPDRQFIPLDVALANRDLARQQIKEQSPEQQRLYQAYVGHREGWIGLIQDLGGAGYFFDPDRTEAEGSFFFCFPEDSSYVFYPRFANYLAAVVEGEKAGVFGVGTQGVITKDFAKGRDLLGRYGSRPSH